jgi:sodium transport system ATP-binding protein
MSLVEVKNLKKTFKDKKLGFIDAVSDISFSFEAGEVFGLLGPNGAGKTTLLRMLSTILSPTEGTATIGGYDIRENPLEVRSQIGFLTGNTGLYSRLTAVEMLYYIGSLYGMDKETLITRCDDVSELLDMKSFLHRKCGQLSTGQKQRISIARTIIHDPPVLFLDEPTLGLDVMTGRTIISFIKKAREQGKGILLSTHEMEIVEKLADKICLIHMGHVIASGTLEELMEKTGEKYLDDVFLSLIEEDNDKINEMALQSENN